MLRIVKKILFWDKIYPAVRKTPLFGLWHGMNGKIASITHGNPAEKLFVIGVTGTDGKTTTTLLIQHLVNKLAGKCIAISTESVVIDKEKITNKLKMSSLSPYRLQEYLDIAVKRGCRFAVLETTSHGLDQRRFEGIGFSCGVLTNITPEHLDYHGTLENYALAKRRLFERVIENDTVYKWAVLPKDDEWGRKWANEMPFDKIVDYGINMNCSLRAENIVAHIEGTDFDIKYLGDSYPVKTRLIGKFNVYNYLAAVSVGLLMGGTIKQIVDAMEDYTPIDGRQDKVIYNDVTYFIDFAHTPNGLSNILNLLKENKNNGRIITVFGAPGLRDRYKRPEMGGVVDMLSDVVVLTEDDSMTESTQQIIKEVAKGIQRQEGDNYFIIPHRKDAVRFATEIAQPGDIVLLAGKGHETALYTNFGKIEYHERTYLEELLGITQH